MEAFFNRYRHVSLLVVVVFAQLILLAWQIKTNQEAHGVRVWAVTAVTPLARFVEEIRYKSVHFFSDYLAMANVQQRNLQLVAESNRLKLENQTLRNEVQMADRVRAMATFVKESPFKYLGARIINNAPGTNSKVVYIDRGSTSGVRRGMSVLTPDGIVGKVVASYPTAAQVMLINDLTFSGAVITQKHRTRGVVKGQGHVKMLMDYVQNEEKLEVGELVFTSGEDRIFPKGLAVGKIASVKDGPQFKEVVVVPSGFREGLEEVLVLTEGGHQPLPAAATPPAPEVTLLPEPKGDDGTGNKFEATPEKTKTEADRIRERYKQIEQWNGGQMGTSGRIPNYNVVPVPAAPAAAPPGATPPATPPAQ
ncbi:MAG: rod shape-determining protein MreC [Bryobacteraceae bacterium]|nr:rod shape-determining protein MreC [Bryobacteraceae bacterium]